MAGWGNLPAPAPCPGPPMLVVDRPEDLARFAGQEIGLSDWITIDQPMIDGFAEATGDRQWIHVDVDRAARDMPGGKTIAHGFLLLSLLPRLAQPLMQIRAMTRGINYGLNRVRFTHVVESGARVRLRLKLLTAEPVEGRGMRITCDNRLEIEGAARAALVAETVVLAYP